MGNKNSSNNEHILKDLYGKNDETEWSKSAFIRKIYDESNDKSDKSNKSDESSDSFSDLLEILAEKHKNDPHYMKPSIDATVKLTVNGKTYEFSPNKPVGTFSPPSSVVPDFSRLMKKKQEGGFYDSDTTDSDSDSIEGLTSTESARSDSEEGVVLTGSEIDTSDLYRLQNRVFTNTESDNDSDEYTASESYGEKVSKAVRDKGLQNKIFSSESRKILGMGAASDSVSDDVKPRQKNPKYII